MPPGDRATEHCARRIYLVLTLVWRMKKAANQVKPTTIEIRWRAPIGASGLTMRSCSAATRAAAVMNTNTARPLSSEYQAHRRDDQACSATTMATTLRVKNTMTDVNPWTASWNVGGDGVRSPGGYPKPGSVTKMPAATSPTATTPMSTVTAREVRVRNRPAVPAKRRTPQSTKLAICTQPRWPVLSWLTKLRHGSYPGRVAPSTKNVITKRAGPSAPQVNSARVLTGLKRWARRDSNPHALSSNRP